MPSDAIAARVGAEDKSALKKEFKQLVRAINTNLSQIETMKKQPMKYGGSAELGAAGSRWPTFNSQTYIHYNASQNL